MRVVMSIAKIHMTDRMGKMRYAHCSRLEDGLFCRGIWIESRGMMGLYLACSSASRSSDSGRMTEGGIWRTLKESMLKGTWREER